MRRFRFRLQKILDVIVKKEQAVKERLFELSLDIVRAQQELLERDMALRAACEVQAEDRLRGQCRHEDFFDRHCRQLEAQIDAKRVRVDQLALSRLDAVKMLEETTHFRRSLERARENALNEHRRFLARDEQKLLDEHAGIKFIRTRDRLTEV